MSIAEIQAAIKAGRLDAESLVKMYLARIETIDRNGPTLRSVQEINPDAIPIARALDEERKAGRSRGPLHGIPVLLKDNIATADKMETTAGTLALVGARPREDSTIAQRLRQAGAIILGKASMSEWAYFKSTPGSSGWSARSGQARNPYALNRTPCGSSSGSAIAVAASLVTVSIGTETDGSIICPAGRQRRGRHQADGGAHEPRGRDPDLGDAGHDRLVRAHRRRRRRAAGRARRRRCARSGDAGERGQVAERLREVPRPQRASRRADRRAPRRILRLQPEGRRGRQSGARGAARRRAR
jgi:hypothetical protein